MSLENLTKEELKTLKENVETLKLINSVPVVSLLFAVLSFYGASNNHNEVISSLLYLTGGASTLTTVFATNKIYKKIEELDEIINEDDKHKLKLK